MFRIKFIAGVVATFATVAQVSAGFVDITQGYNLISFGNTTLTNSDVEGRVAVGGLSNYIDAYSIGLKATESADQPYSLISAGNVTYNNGSVLNGGVYAGGNAVLNGVAPIEGNVVRNGASNLNNVFDFNGIRSDLLTLSSTYTSTAQNGIVTKTGGNFSLVGTSDVNYFTINGSLLQSGWANNLNFSLLNANAINIINIVGSINASEFNLSMSGNNASKTLLNFTGDDAFNLLGSINSSILATNMDINFLYGEVNGQVVADKITAGSQFNLVTFNEPPQNVPEGSTTVMMIAGALMLIVVSRKKLSFARK
jgi:choice-of-anchor A domain-containing protein